MKTDNHAPSEIRLLPYGHLIHSRVRRLWRRFRQNSLEFFEGFARFHPQGRKWPLFLKFSENVQSLLHGFRGLALFIQCHVSERKLGASARSCNLHLGVGGIVLSKPGHGGVASTKFVPSFFELVLCEKCDCDETVCLGCLSLPHRICRIDSRNRVHAGRILAKFIARDSGLSLSLERFANIFVGPGKTSLPVSIARIDLRELAKDLLARVVLGQGGIESLLLEKNPADVAVGSCQLTQLFRIIRSFCNELFWIA